MIKHISLHLNIHIRSQIYKKYIKKDEVLYYGASIIPDKSWLILWDKIKEHQNDLPGWLALQDVTGSTTHEHFLNNNSQYYCVTHKPVDTWGDIAESEFNEPINFHFDSDPESQIDRADFRNSKNSKSQFPEISKSRISEIRKSRNFNPRNFNFFWAI